MEINGTQCERSVEEVMAEGMSLKVIQFPPILPKNSFLLCFRSRRHGNSSLITLDVHFQQASMVKYRTDIVFDWLDLIGKTNCFLPLYYPECLRLILIKGDDSSRVHRVGVGEWSRCCVHVICRGGVGADGKSQRPWFLVCITCSSNNDKYSINHEELLASVFWLPSRSVIYVAMGLRDGHFNRISLKCLLG